jgi:hypothetical protein
MISNGIRRLFLVAVAIPLAITGIRRPSDAAALRPMTGDEPPPGR